MDTQRSPIIELANVETYYGRIMALRGVSLSVPEGMIVTILGANGAGKTTILKTISGIMKASKGSIKLEERSLAGLDGAAVVERGISHVPEGREIFPFLSVRENLLMGAYLRKGRDEIEQDIEFWLERFPILRERRQQPAGLLSGGQQQMLAIARAMMARPKVLLMDEPSLGLSPLLTREIFDIVKQINAKLGTTVLVVEQNARIALDTAHYGYILELGRIVLEGTAQQLADNEDVKEFYLGLGEASVRDEQRWKRRKTWH